MTIALPRLRQDPFGVTMRRRLDVLVSYLEWDAAITAEPSPWGAAASRFRIERAASGFNWDEATYIIDAMPKRLLIADKNLSWQLLAERGADGTIFGIMTESTVVEQMVANLSILMVGRLQPHDDGIMEAIWETELLPGQAMTRAVLEARLVRQGFSKKAVFVNLVKMIGDGALSIDLNQPFTSGSLISRRMKQERPAQFALPWVQVRTYC